MSRLEANAITISCGVLISTIALAGGFELTRHTVDGGGTTSSEGGGFELSATVGQPDAGVLSGGGFHLVGGFWFESPPGDCNSDGLTNLLEFVDFSACFTGPEGSLPPGCACFDGDGDGDVDLFDFGRFQSGFNQ